MIISVCFKQKNTTTFSSWLESCHGYCRQEKASSHMFLSLTVDVEGVDAFIFKTITKYQQHLAGSEAI